MLFTNFELDTILAALYELQGNHEPNDDDFSEDSYGSGSALTFNSSELEEIKNPSEFLINQCKNVINLFT